MARPKKATDEQIFEAAYRVMMRRGPADWTLADIAGEAGLTAGALVQRFGSKRELMLALMERFAASSGEMFDQLRASAVSPLQTIMAYGECMAEMGASTEMLAHHLSYLQLDLTDPDYHVHFKAQAEAARAAIRGLLEEAVSAGELDLREGSQLRMDTEKLARAIQLTVTGSLFTWATYQEGSATDWMRHDLGLLLAPYRS